MWVGRSVRTTSTLRCQPSTNAWGWGCCSGPSLFLSLFALFSWEEEGKDDGEGRARELEVERERDVGAVAQDEDEAESSSLDGGSREREREREREIVRERAREKDREMREIERERAAKVRPPYPLSSAAESTAYPVALRENRLLQGQVSISLFGKMILPSTVSSG